MKQNRLVGALLGVVWLWLASGALAQQTITNFLVAQRPGTKLVDITYDVVSTGEFIAVSLIVENSGEPVNAESMTGNVGLLSPGPGKSIVWNMGADWNGNLAVLSFSLSAEVVTPLYMVVDLSGGTTAVNYPVSYLQDMPTEGWTDVYKTTKLVLRRISSGTFTMGSPVGEPGRSANAEAQRVVTLTKDFYIGVFEVTQRQWERVMGNWPSRFYNSTYRTFRPVENVCYTNIRGSSAGSKWPSNSNVDATSFMGRLRAKTGLSTFDLPTEAQWEYACRAGTTTALNSGKSITPANMAEVGRYHDNHPDGYSEDPSVGLGGGTAKVGSYLPNMWGLFDMHGNVYEWCLDWLENAPSETTDPKGPASGGFRVQRGGSWPGSLYPCRSAARGGMYPYDEQSFFGFRAARSLP